MGDQPGEPTAFKTFVYDSARWDGFAFRDGDIVISTPAKCGTTWMQMLCALLLFRTPELPALAGGLSPWLDMTDAPARRGAGRPRGPDPPAVHQDATPHSTGIPWDDRVTYLTVARDPRDVALSMDNHMANMDLDRLIELRAAVAGLDDLAELGMADGLPARPPELRDRFWRWMEGDGTASPSGLQQLVEHASSFWAARDRPNVHLFHYSHLRDDLRGEMGRLAEVLGVDPPTDELVESAGFEQMKSRADQLVPNSDRQLWHSNAQFFDRARSGDWRALIGDDGEPRYEKAIAALTPDPDFLVWLHGGRAAEDATA